MARRYGAQRGGYGRGDNESGYQPKKSNSGLWIGIGISGVILIGIVVILLVTLGGNIGRTTGFSSDDKLKKKDIASFNIDRSVKPPVASPLPSIAEAGGGDATNAISALIAFYEENRASLDSENPTAQHGEALLDLFIGIYDAGTVPGKWFDDQVPMTPQASPKFGAALLDSARAAMVRAFLIHKRDNEDMKQRADKAALAIWALGRNMFDRSKRLPIRTMGMELMRAAGEGLYNWSPDGTERGDAMNKWVNAMNEFDEKYWGPKSEVLMTLRYGEPNSPTLGDLVQIARYDEDLSWRVAATLELGRAKYSKRTSQQDRALQGIISSLKNDKEPAVADAAKIAESYQKSDVRGLGS